MQLEAVKPKSERTRIERAIYQNTGNKKYVIIGYSAETKKTKNLAEFTKLEDAKAWRDDNIRFAKYGKGIKMRKVKDGYKFTANIMLYAGNEITSFYIGSYNTPEEAREARLQFIESLK